MKLLNYQPHQKVTYSGGLISLILLPIFCLWWINNFRQSQIKHALNIEFYNTETDYQLHGYQNYKLSVPHNYQTLTLVDNNAKNATVIEKAKQLLLDLKQRKDETNGVELKFSSNTKYDAFVNALDMLRSIGVVNYINKNNRILCFWNFPQPVRSKPYYPQVFICGNAFMEPDEFLRLRKAALNKNIFNEFWAPALVFIAMGAISIIKLVRR